MKEVILETERLLLRWFREDDFEDFCGICAEPEVMRFLGDGQPLTPMEVWRQMATFMGHWYFRGSQCKRPMKFTKWILTARRWKNSDT